MHLNDFAVVVGKDTGGFGNKLKDGVHTLTHVRGKDNGNLFACSADCGFFLGAETRGSDHNGFLSFRQSAR